MTGKLTFSMLTPDQQRSDYDWMNIGFDDIRIGKVRGMIRDETLTICSIMIFPEFEGRGFARKTIKMFMKSFDTIIADRVRHKAIGFWEKMGFQVDDNGQYIWKRNGH